MPVRGLRAHLLRRLLPPLALLLGLGAITAYFVSLEPARDAYDSALVDIGLALGERIRVAGGAYSFDLPAVAERALRTDKHDTIYYHVRNPDGGGIAGDPGLPPPPGDRLAQDGVIAYDAEYRGRPIRSVSVTVRCADKVCTVQVAETTNKRRALARRIALSSLVPELLIALATLAVVWFGVKRGLAPLENLSAEIEARSARDLHPIDPGRAPEEAKPLVGALNQLLRRAADSNRNQQRFLANAAHQLRTPLAGLQAHVDLALTQPMPGAARSELEEVRKATARAGRLANQLLALARAEPGGHAAESLAPIDLREAAAQAADEWVRRAIERGSDLGFELAPAPAIADALLVREAISNLVHNALEYAPPGSRITLRTGIRAGAPFLEVEDDGHGIALPERENVLERFYRIPGAAGTGSGLGLAIVHEIALAHGARVEIGEGAGGIGCRVALIFAGPHAA